METREACSSSDNILSVYSVGGNILETINWASNTTVADIKLRIQQRRNIPTYRQRLMISDTMLDDGVRLESLVWRNSATFVELPCSSEPMKLDELAMAIREGDTNHVKQLLHEPVFPGHLLLALSCKQHRLAKLLCEAMADVNQKEIFEDREVTPLGLAVAEGDTDMVSCLNAFGADKDQESQIVNTNRNLFPARKVEATPLCIAVLHGHVDTTRLLCDIGTDKCKSVYLGEERTFSEVQKRKQGSCKLLSGTHGPPFDFPMMWTPLTMAVDHGHLEIVSLLCDRGVNLNDWERDTLMYVALHEMFAIAKRPTYYSAIADKISIVGAQKMSCFQGADLIRRFDKKLKVIQRISITIGLPFLVTLFARCIDEKGPFLTMFYAFVVTNLGAVAFAASYNRMFSMKSSFQVNSSLRRFAEKVHHFLLYYIGIALNVSMLRLYVENAHLPRMALIISLATWPFVRLRENDEERTTAEREVEAPREETCGDGQRLIKLETVGSWLSVCTAIACLSLWSTMAGIYSCIRMSCLCFLFGRVCMHSHLIWIIVSRISMCRCLSLASATELPDTNYVQLA